MPKVSWVMSADFAANFTRFLAVQKFWRSVKIWQSYRQFKGGNFFETQCRKNTNSFMTINTGIRQKFEPRRSEQASHGLWGSAGLKMPFHAHCTTWLWPVK